MVTVSHWEITGKELLSALRQSGSSFYWPIRLLPPHQRWPLAAFYLFCRDVDDIADGEATFAEKRDRLQAWRSFVTAPSESLCPHPLLGDIFPHLLREHKITPEVLCEIIAGMEMDLLPSSAPPSLPDLRLYCYRVAGCVGLILIHLLQNASPTFPQRRFAIASGEALQFTNIARDVAEDAARHRLYLPKDFFPPDTPFLFDKLPPITDTVLYAYAWQGTMDLAQQAYQTAFAEFAALPRHERRELWVAYGMLRLYHAVFMQLKRRGYQPNAPRPRLSGWQKGRILLSAWGRTRL